MSKTFNQVLQFSLTGEAVEVEGKKYYKFAQLFMLMVVSHVVFTMVDVVMPPGTRLCFCLM